MMRHVGRAGEVVKFTTTIKVQMINYYLGVSRARLEHDSFRVIRTNNSVQNIHLLLALFPWSQPLRLDLVFPLQLPFNHFNCLRMAELA